MAKTPKVQRYYYYRDHLEKILKHPDLANVQRLEIRKQREIRLDRNNVGHYSVCVYLVCDEDQFIEIYRPYEDVDQRANACLQYLRKYLIKTGRIDA